MARREKGHRLRECKKEWKRNLCRELDHMFYTCPRSFTSTIKRRQGGENMASVNDLCILRLGGHGDGVMARGAGSSVSSASVVAASGDCPQVAAVTAVRVG